VVQGFFLCYQESALALSEGSTTKENRPRKSSQAAGSCHKVLGRANTRKPRNQAKDRDHQSVDVSRRIGDPRNQVPSSPRRHNALICLPSRHGGGRMADRWFASSTTCSCCGSVKSEPELLRRVFRCDHGAFLADRDWNAAKKSQTFGRTLCAVSLRRGALWRGSQDVLETGLEERGTAELCAA
jgi:Putative transposase DNA-binding domain